MDVARFECEATAPTGYKRKIYSNRNFTVEVGYPRYNKKMPIQFAFQITQKKRKTSKRICSLIRVAISSRTWRLVTCGFSHGRTLFQLPDDLALWSLQTFQVNNLLSICNTQRARLCLQRLQGRGDERHNSPPPPPPREEEKKETCTKEIQGKRRKFSFKREEETRVGEDVTKEKRKIKTESDGGFRLPSVEGKWRFTFHGKKKGYSSSKSCFFPFFDEAYKTARGWFFFPFPFFSFHFVSIVVNKSFSGVQQTTLTNR